MNRMTGSVVGISSVAGLVAFGFSFAAIAAETADQGESSGGMPQLDPSTFGTQLFWLAVTFTLLYLLMSKKVLPAVEGVIDERNDRIQGDLDAAAKLRADAEDLYASYEAQLAAATAKAQETVAVTREKITMANTERSSKLQAELDAKIDKAVAELTAASNKALKGIDEVASEVAIVAVERLIGVKVSVDEARAAAAAVK